MLIKIPAEILLFIIIGLIILAIIVAIIMAVLRAASSSSDGLGSVAGTIRQRLAGKRPKENDEPADQDDEPRNRDA